MCWISKNLVEQKSDGKVEIYKVCGIDKNNVIRSYFRPNFTYVLNIPNQTKVSINQHENEYYGFNGLHSYSAKLTEWKREKYTSKQDCIHIKSINSNMWLYPLYTPLFCKPMFYSDQKHSAVRKEHIAVIKGYIPKGASYYVNSHGEIISEEIVLTEIIQTIEYYA